MNSPDPNNVGTHGSCVHQIPDNTIAPHPERKSPRAAFNNYSNGDFFVTICTNEKRHYFGEIYDGKMHYNALGLYCAKQIEEISEHYGYAAAALYVVMPNHVHIIICIDDTNLTHEPGNDQRTHEPCVPTVRTALSVVIGGFKRAVTMFARRNNIKFEWQSRYHDHIIRSNRDGNQIAEYIKNNVARWANDCFHE